MLDKEIETLIFCSFKKPQKCLIETNLCCVYCHKKVECMEQTHIGITPCDLTQEELIEEDCDLLI